MEFRLPWNSQKRVIPSVECGTLTENMHTLHPGTHAYSGEPHTAASRPTMEPAIETCELVKQYRGKTRALDGLTLTVPAGAVYALLGPNGAGKSTAVKVLTTLSQPDSGSAKVAAIDVVHQPEPVRRVIGCVMQKTSVDIDATGRENLLLQGQLYGLRGGALKERANELLESLHLAGKGNQIVRTYSGGMQRKLDIAMGLVHRPRVLFLDEPTTGLDPDSRSELWREIAALSSRDRITVLLTTHYLEEADQLAARVGFIDRGKLVIEGSPDDLKDRLSGDVLTVGFDAPPPANALASALDRAAVLRDWTLNGHILHGRTARGAKAVPILLAALDAAGLSAASVTVARPTLDDVYLHYTGRTIREAEGERRS